jgi:P27 family predicted phage terminase small subunit
MGARGRKSVSELMTPPPPVRLVEPELPVELPAPPDHLTPATQDWWRQIVAAYELEPHHLKILEAAADAWDRLVTARTELLRDGLTVQGVHGPKTHPAVNVERDSRAAFARLIRELDLDEPMPPPGRYMPPPAIRSNRRR